MTTDFQADLRQLVLSSNPTSLAAQYNVPASVLQAARTPRTDLAGAYVMNGLVPFVGNNASYLGHALLNGSDASGLAAGGAPTRWTAFNGAVAVNRTPPAGGPQNQSQKYTPNGSTGFGHAYPGGGMGTYPGISYSVTAIVNASSTADVGQLGIDFVDETQATTTLFADFTLVSGWATWSATFTAPAGAIGGQAWAGLAANSGNVSAAHTLDCEGVYVFVTS
jgi:hypothetical protein